MNKPKICAVITDGKIDSLAEIERIVDMFELRIDLVGDRWQEVTSKLHKPWIAANRTWQDGGKWTGSEEARMNELMTAVNLGAYMVDIELQCNLVKELALKIKGKAKLLISFHDWEGTPPLEKLADIAREQLHSGADICKIVTTAKTPDDNISLLKLIHMFPWANMIAFAMGRDGMLSRILSPLSGGYLTYASLKEGSESAPGQLTAAKMQQIYGLLEQ
jgi:3-dehydroquinate dehydratase I